jgi:carbonic anhydrase
MFDVEMCGEAVQMAFMTLLFAATAALVFFTSVPAHAAHWSYKGDTGPSHWAELDPDFGAAIREAQSPIDVRPSAAAGHHGKELAVHYRAGDFTILNNGHTIQIAPASPGENYITLGGERFELTQFHFHSPSEHLIDGKSSGMEMHFVHVSASGRVSVMAVMFSEGEANPALAEAWKNMPETAGGKPRALPAKLDMTKLLPSSLENIQYNGSLTTPPTNEGVLWVILEKHLTASAEQIKQFNGVIGDNARPAQPLNGRMMYKGEGAKD